MEWATQPEDGRTKHRFYPKIDRAAMFTRGYVATRSGHSRGSAIDLTLFRLDTGELAAMGGGHDLMDERSHHGAPDVSDIEACNRSTLCSLMEHSGFQRYDCEWFRRQCRVASGRQWRRHRNHRGKQFAASATLSREA